VQNLARGVENARDALGEDSFSVLTIGFDVRNDHPARMRAYQRAQDIGLANWVFLGADEQTIHGLTEDLGFLYYPAAQGFDHLAQTTILDAGGTVYRQVYGADAGVREIVEPLKSLRMGQVSGLTSLDDIVERIRLFCTLYDPASDAYRFDWSFFTGLGVGLFCIGMLTAFLIHVEVQRRRAGRRA
jgi:protein SCO1/2